MLLLFSTTPALAEIQALPTSCPPFSISAHQVWMSFGLVVAGTLTLRLIGPRLAAWVQARFDPWREADSTLDRLVEAESYSKFAEDFAVGTHSGSSPGTGAETAAARRLMDPGLAEFFHALRASMKGELSYALHEAPDAMRESRERLRKFLATAPGYIASLKTVFAEVSQAPDEMARLQVLRKFVEQLSLIKSAARFPAVLPLWQLASALEGLLKQVTSNPSHVTASALRTAAGALDLMEALCIPNLRPDLTTNPPVRLMAVDDDPISRHAVKAALSKIFDPPDLANDGKGGLDLVQHIKYDVIFLDVEMPGMDGFELCTKIQQIGLNRSTPVVFVTCHSDLESRARSMLTGAQELIGKPFLSSELALKALTLVIRGRLDESAADRISARRNAMRASQPAVASTNADRADTTQAHNAGEKLAGDVTPLVPLQSVPASSNVNSVALERTAAGSSGLLSPTLSSRGGEGEGDKDRLQSTREPTSGVKGGADSLKDQPRLRAEDFAQAVLSHAPTQLQELRGRLQKLIRAYHPMSVHEFLGELFVGVHALNGEAERGELRSVYKLGYALEGMLKKLVEKPGLCTHSTLHAAAAALELLEELCRKGIDAKLTDPPVHLLVVDDDPLARRAICGALQLAFERPESAESGEAAVTLADEKAFDLIFLDVMMPGMNGFTACERIHERDLNQNTPVVFVTSQDDVKSRNEAEAAGGRGFIPKPVLASEIMLTALTFILRSRLDRSEKTPRVEQSRRPVHH